MPVNAAGPMPAAPSFVAGLTPPERFGYVASSFSPHKEAAAPRLILISDLHAHVEVQHNIVGILHDLINKLNPAPGHTVPIYVEGGWEQHLEEPLRIVSDADARAFLSEYLLQKSQIGSAQAFSEEIAGSGKVSLVGVENKAEYEANRKRYIKTYPARKQLLIGLAREEKALRELSSYLSNGAFEKLQAMRDEYNAGRITPDRYAKALAKQADHLHIVGSAVDTLKNSRVSNSNDLDVALAQVYGAVAVRLSSKAPWTAFLRQSLGDEQTMRANIAHFDADFDLLKRLVANQLTPGEVPLAMARMPYLTHMAQALVSDHEAGMNVKSVVEQSIDFYPYAFLRDKILVQNSLKALDAAGDPNATGILVVGGFHADSIEQYLLSHGISYLHINPTVTRDLTTEEEFNYARRMGDDPVNAEEFKEDLARLSQSGKQALTSGSAIAPASNTAPPAKPDAMGGGGLARLLVGKQNGERLNVLKAQGLKRAIMPWIRGVDDPNIVRLQDLQQLAWAARSGELNTAIRDRIDKLDLAFEAVKEENATLKDLPFFRDQSFSLDLLADRSGYRNRESFPLSPRQQAFLDKVNEIHRGRSEEERAAAPMNIDVHVTPDEGAILMGAESLVFHGYRNSEAQTSIGRKPWAFKEPTDYKDYEKPHNKTMRHTIVILTESRMQDPNNPDTTEFLQQLGTQYHEISHLLLFAQRKEARAISSELLYGSKAAVGHFTNMDASAAVKAFLDAIAPQITLYNGQFTVFAKQFADPRFRNDLAEQIARVIQGPNLSDAQIKQIASNLKAQYPELPEYLIAQSLEATTKSMMDALGGDDNPEYVAKEVQEETEKNLKPKAKSLGATLKSV
jgi:hypothetical protein